VEQFVYIHGVVGDKTRRKKHTEDYTKLRDGISNELQKRGEPELPSIRDSVTVEWGWPTQQAGDTASLARAQSHIADRVAAATPRDRTGFTSMLFAPAVEPVRNLLMLGWSDILYYVGKGGKKRVRSLIWNEILNKVGTAEKTDLTIVAHSAGTLIAHDLLFWIFSGDRSDEMGVPGMPDPQTFAAARRNWRIRRLVTFGSPISALMIRSAEVADIMAGSGTPKLDATKLGFGRRSHSGKEPIWLNVWDRHDVLSYPIKPFYEGAEVVDIYPDHSDSLFGSHEAYWGAKSVHKALAERWG
jgi:hypothetical protein